MLVQAPGVMLALNSNILKHLVVWCAHRVEEAYLDAYEGEGWRGANREKLRPTAELEQARLQVPQESLVYAVP